MAIPLHSRLLTALVVACALSAGPGWSAATAAPKTVVVLYPENAEGSPGSVLVNRSLRATFATAPSPIRVRNEYLDLARFESPGERRILVDFLRRKYEGQRVDLVMAGLSSALDFALAHRDEIFPGVPVVFIAVDPRELAARELPADVVGNPMTMDFAGTLDLALRLQPDTRRVFVVVGKSRFDAEWERLAREQFRRFEGRIATEYLSGLPMADLLARVADLPPQSIVQYVSVFEDGTGKTFIPADVLEAVSAAANAPVYGDVDSFIGRGIVGGRVASFERAGRDAAEIAVRIFAGTSPAAIARDGVTPTVNMFDWRQLRRWQLERASLPPSSVVRFADPTLWDLYRTEILGFLGVIVLQTVLIGVLVAERASRRRADARFRQVLATAPYAVLIVGPGGAIEMANARTERLFGYRRDELVGRPVEMLVPERLRADLAEYRERFSGAPEVRPMGAGRELVGRRKDGTEFPVEVALGPAQPSAGRSILATIVDVSPRKRAEEDLRRTEVELRRLTGRLLQAQEDESRRIARELHDDLGQGLALLTIEMDLLRKKPPTGADQISARLQGLLTHARQLSSSVHELSHGLHPAKLEQLGIASAIGSLCRELTRTHGLAIECTPPDSLTVPGEVAVCLYRVVQEGLRNAIKHAAARRATVALSNGGGMVALRIADDGRGFDARAATDHRGLGLVSMRERVLHLGGHLTIDSAPSRGTRIEVEIPLPPIARTGTA